MKPEPSIDTDRIDDAVLALLYLGICERHEDTGLIHDPVGKAKSVWITEEGLKRAEALFHAMFAKAADR